MKRGEIWIADLDPVVGHEQAGRRPTLIVSGNQFNASNADLVAVLPITSQPRRVPTPSRVRVVPPEGGLNRESWIICEQVRTVSKRRLHGRLGTVTVATMVAVEDAMRLILELP